MQARVLLLKNFRQHFIERDYDYKRFTVETQQPKSAKVAPRKEAIGACASSDVQ